MFVATLVLLASLGGAPPPIDCAKLCDKVIESCANGCKAKKKRGEDVKNCSAQCDAASKMCEERCKGAKSAQSDPAKAAELRKKMGLDPKKNPGGEP